MPCDVSLRSSHASRDTSNRSSPVGSEFVDDAASGAWVGGDGEKGPDREGWACCECVSHFLVEEVIEIAVAVQGLKHDGRNGGRTLSSNLRTVTQSAAGQAFTIESGFLNGGTI